jgi:hypothetical protein
LEEEEVEVGTRTPKVRSMGKESKGSRARSSRSGAGRSTKMVGKAVTVAARKKDVRCIVARLEFQCRAEKES